MECLIALLFFGGIIACGYFFIRLRRFERATRAELQAVREALATVQATVQARLGGGAPDELAALVSSTPEIAPGLAPSAPSTPAEPDAELAPPALEQDQVIAPREHLPAPALATAAPALTAAPSVAPSAPAPPSLQETRQPTISVPPAGPGWREHPVVRWFLDSHMVVRVGIVILFIGVAFLVSFAADQGWFSLEMRLVSAGLLGVGLVYAGWRVRARRRIYGLSLQGGGLGIAYMTTFAAFGLYELLPAWLAFGLLAAIGLACGALAVLNDAKALAVLAVTGAFAAPILASSGEGSHMALFSYFALINAAILGIAWFKAWRALNLVGFLFTLALASLWGAEYYRPEFYGSVQPFLILFLLFYVTIGVLFARRQPPRLVGLVDGPLVFGAPAVAFLWQARLVADFDYGLAWSAVLLGAFYLALGAALFLLSSPHYAALRESYLAIGAVFVMLAVPFAFEAPATAMIWAVSGAGLFWVGLRQRRRFHAFLGGVVQLAGGFWNVVHWLDLTFSEGPSGLEELPLFLNSFALGGILLALAGLVTGYLALSYARQGARLLVARDLYVIKVGATLWGLLWWYGVGLYEIIRAAPPIDAEISVPVLFMVLSGAIGVAIAARLNWWSLRVTGLLLWLPVAAFAGVEASMDKPLFSGWGWLAWPGALVVHYYLVRGLARLRHAGSRLAWLPRLYHALGLWLASWLGTVELLARVAAWDAAGQIWTAVAWAALPAAMIVAVTWGGARLARLLESGADPAWQETVYRTYMRLALAPLALYLVGWTFALTWIADGDAAPLAYAPILNPLGMMQIVIFVSLFLWLNRLQREGMRGAFATAGRVIGLTLVVLAVSGELARLGHQWWGIDFTFAALLDSPLLQAAYSILWTMLATIFMFWGAWRVRRWLWLMGAALLALTIFKLFLVDLSGAETLARIVSFIGVGLLMLLIGYFAPMPPLKRREPLSGMEDVASNVAD